MPDYERDEMGSIGSCQTHRAAVGAGHVEAIEALEYVRFLLFRTSTSASVYSVRKYILKTMYGS